MTPIVLDALAVFRLWRLAAEDVITDDIRSRWEAWVYDRYGQIEEPGKPQPTPKLLVLVGCPWCLGWWLTIVVFAWSRVSPRTWQVARDVLATSAIVGLVAEAEDRLHG